MERRALFTYHLGRASPVRSLTMGTTLDGSLSPLDLPLTDLSALVLLPLPLTLILLLGFHLNSFSLLLHDGFLRGSLLPCDKGLLFGPHCSYFLGGTPDIGSLDPWLNLDHFFACERSRTPCTHDKGISTREDMLVEGGRRITKLPGDIET